MKYLYLILTGCIFIIGCGKDYLDVKPNKSLLVPTNFEDFQALMDNITLMNIVPGLNAIAHGDYIIEDAYQQNLTEQELKGYLWKDNVAQGSTLEDWNQSYKQVFVANVILDGIAKIDITNGNRIAWSTIKGRALFFRAFAFFNLSQLFTQPYHTSTAMNLPGIPLRTVSDVNIKRNRGTLQQTYDQIINDLIEAELLLSEELNLKNRPGKAAARALLARVYLSQGNYDKAGFYADECLKLNGKLIQYNRLDTNEVIPFPDPIVGNNEEIIFSYDLLGYGFFSSGIIKVTEDLYQSYSKDDLRKPLYFYEEGDQGVYFTGYKGLCTDEMYLIKAECLARKGDKDEAIRNLNFLLSHRWAKDKFVEYRSNQVEDALKLILSERRKELVGRELRWTDLRRLNQDPLFAVTLKRNSMGMDFFLYPQDKRYTMLIPDEEISLNKIPQNER